MKIKHGLRPVVRIKEILEPHELTQKELAEMIGEAPQQVNKWVNGVEPCLNALGRIAIALGVKLADLVWYGGDDASFNKSSIVYIRGQVADALHKTTSIAELLEALGEYYRWTAEERAGVKIVNTDWQKGEITLGCSGESEAFITWAKKDRDSMYRL